MTLAFESMVDSTVNSTVDTVLFRQRGQGVALHKKIIIFDLKNDLIIFNYLNCGLCWVVRELWCAWPVKGRLACSLTTQC